jgi:cysteinyl-tRNA synthetase
MADDLNTPVALSVLFDIVKEINRLTNLALPLGDMALAFSTEPLAENKAMELRYQAASQLADLLKDLASTLGLLQEDPQTFLADPRHKKLNPPPELPALSQQEIEELQQARETARKNKDFAEADRIRDLLQKHGVSLAGDKKIK